MKKNIIYWVIFLGIVISCISPYEPTNIKSTEGLLVVEANLLAPYGTEVRLSRTVSLENPSHSSSFMPYMPVSGEVKIVSDDGEEYRMTETAVGTFELEQEFIYRKNAKYALDMFLGGKHYRSEYITPLQTPEVDTLTWVYNEKYKRVDIMASIDNPNVDATYYQWKYNEDWEIRAPNFATHRWDPDSGRVIRNEVYNSNNRLYCWAKDSSRNFILGSSDKLISSAMRDNKIKEIPYGEARVSNLYHISVKQYAISKEAYSYFRNLQNNVETTGSIFAPQPTEMKSNITCLSDPEETVIGFFVATTETTIAMYIQASEVPEMQALGFGCSEIFTDFAGSEDAYNNGYGLISYPNPIQYMLFRCVDCTFRGGTKDRPEWWPNNHY